jgi:hypothetical protein
MFQIDLMPDEVKKLEAHVKERGYETIEDWLRAVVQIDDEEEETVKQFREDFKQSWLEMKRGEVMTLEEMDAYLASDDDD